MEKTNGKNQLPSQFRDFKQFVNEDSIYKEIKSILFESNSNLTMENLPYQKRRHNQLKQKSISTQNVRFFKLTENPFRRSKSTKSISWSNLKTFRSSERLKPEAAKASSKKKKNLRLERKESKRQVKSPFRIGKKLMMKKSKSENKMTTTLNCSSMRRYKEYMQTKGSGSRFKISYLPSEWNKNVKILPHETERSKSRNKFSRF